MSQLPCVFVLAPALSPGLFRPVQPAGNRLEISVSGVWAGAPAGNSPANPAQSGRGLSSRAGCGVQGKKIVLLMTGLTGGGAGRVTLNLAADWSRAGARVVATLAAAGADWLRGPLREWGWSLLCPEAVRRHGVLRAGAMERAWRVHQSGRQNLAFPLWTALMLQDWLERKAGRG